jgi:ubiquinone/menaquinone biosynthesis C-methylase UbiE
MAHRINYESRLARSFDGRTLSQAKEALWLKLFEEYLGLSASSRVLDVGCGTGRFAGVIANRLECAVIGIDPSFEMLTSAKAKFAQPTGWFLAQAEAIPFSQNTFDVCLCSFVIHHIVDKARAFREMYRTLRPNGRLGIRYLSHEQLCQDPLYRFFPAALTIDLARTPDLVELRGLVQDIGFVPVVEKVVRQPRAESAEEYLEKLRNRYVSSLWMISEEEYQRGMAEAVEYYSSHSLTENESQQEIMFLVYTKSVVVHRRGA